MGVIKGSFIYINETDKIKIENLNQRDNVLSIKSDKGIINYKHPGRSLQFNFSTINFKYSNSYIYYKWESEVKRYYVINDKLKITLDHVICVYRNNKYTWDYVKSLEIGDKLIKNNFELEEITNIEEKEEKTKIYNINLSGFYNYLCEGYLLHNTGACDQDLAFNVSSSNASVSLPSGSCAYCGIENKFLWGGAHKWLTTNATMPPVKYVGITDYGGDESGSYRTYLELPRQWYDSSMLRKISLTSGQWYHIYLDTTGQWTSKDGNSSGPSNLLPSNSDITPHDLKGLLNNGSDNVDSNFSKLQTYNAYCQTATRVSFKGGSMVAYGLTSGDGISGSQTSGGNGVIRTGTSTTGGTDIDNWEEARFVFSFMKSSANTRTDTISLNGTTTGSQSHAVARWRFYNMKGGEVGNAHPKSSGYPSTTGGYAAGDTDDDYAWGNSWQSVSITLAACFEVSTLVNLQNGTTKQYGELVPGDIVISFSINGLTETDDAEIYLNESELDNITGTTTSSTVESINTYTYHYYFFINNTIKVTSEHPIMIKRNNGWKWRKAHEIQQGDNMYNINDGETLVNSIENVSETISVATINVSTINTYFAGGILAHNK